MHMADALLSPAVGGAMLAVSVGVAAYSIKKVQDDTDDSKIPLMGVVGAFIFAAQMINFTIPGTGSSGHIGGGLLLAALLGPHAAFLTMASVLLIQALFFGDGGLLAYGCNVFNLGFFACFIAYPLIYKKIMQKGFSHKRILTASILAVVVALQLGSFAVVLETVISGKTELPFQTFVLFMQPIHLAIGFVEGLVTTAVITFVWNARPEILKRTALEKVQGRDAMKKVLTGLLVATLFVGGILSWFASDNPDGLEWSMEKTAGKTELAVTAMVQETLAAVQEKTTFLPDYGFKAGGEESEQSDESWPAVNSGTTVSGVVGAGMTMALACLIGLGIRLIKNRVNKSPA